MNNKKHRLEYKSLFLDHYDYIDQYNHTFMFDNLNRIKRPILVRNPFQRTSILVNLITIEGILGTKTCFNSPINRNNSVYIYLIINNSSLFLTFDYFLLFFIQNPYIALFKDNNNFLITFFQFSKFSFINDFYYCCIPR
jgi:hypothetical protein